MMQMYPGGGYAQHYYEEVEEDHFAADDYHYNNEYSHQSMQMKPSQHGPAPVKSSGASMDYYKEDYRYKSGAAVQMKKPDQWTSGPPKHNYNQMHGYGGYDQRVESFKHGDQWKASPAKHNNYNQMHGYGGYDHNADSFKYGPKDFNVQYSEEWYEEEQQYDAWSSRNSYAGHGNNHYMVEKGGGYGAHQAPHMPIGQQRPIWTAKSIQD